MTHVAPASGPGMASVLLAAAGLLAPQAPLPSALDLRLPFSATPLCPLHWHSATTSIAIANSNAAAAAAAARPLGAQPFPAFVVRLSFAPLTLPARPRGGRSSTVGKKGEHENDGEGKVVVVGRGTLHGSSPAADRAEHLLEVWRRWCAMRPHSRLTFPPLAAQAQVFHVGDQRVPCVARLLCATEVHLARSLASQLQSPQETAGSGADAETDFSSARALRGVHSSGSAGAAELIARTHTASLVPYFVELCARLHEPSQPAATGAVARALEAALRGIAARIVELTPHRYATVVATAASAARATIGEAGGDSAASRRICVLLRQWFLTPRALALVWPTSSGGRPRPAGTGADVWAAATTLRCAVDVLRGASGEVVAAILARLGLEVSCLAQRQRVAGWEFGEGRECCSVAEQDAQEAAAFACLLYPNLPSRVVNAASILLRVPQWRPSSSSAIARAASASPQQVLEEFLMCSQRGKLARRNSVALLLHLHGHRGLCEDEVAVDGSGSAAATGAAGLKEKGTTTSSSSSSRSRSKTAAGLLKPQERLLLLVRRCVHCIVQILPSDLCAWSTTGAQRRHRRGLSQRVRGAHERQLDAALTLKRFLTSRAVWQHIIDDPEGLGDPATAAQLRHLYLRVATWLLALPHTAQLGNDFGVASAIGMHPAFSRIMALKLMAMQQRRQQKRQEEGEATSSSSSFSSSSRPGESKKKEEDRAFLAAVSSSLRACPTSELVLQLALVQQGARHERVSERRPAAPLVTTALIEELRRRAAGHRGLSHVAGALRLVSGSGSDAHEGQLGAPSGLRLDPSSLVALLGPVLTTPAQPCCASPRASLLGAAAAAAAAAARHSQELPPPWWEVADFLAHSLGDAALALGVLSDAPPPSRAHVRLLARWHAEMAGPAADVRCIPRSPVTRAATLLALVAEGAVPWDDPRAQAVVDAAKHACAPQRQHRRSRPDSSTAATTNGVAVASRELEWGRNVHTVAAQGQGLGCRLRKALLGLELRGAKEDRW